MVPHKVNGTHVFFYNKIIIYAFCKKARKTKSIMANKKNQNADQFRTSKTEQLFSFVKDENEKIFIAIANYKASRKSFDTFEQAERYVASKPYELLINTFFIIQKLNEKQDYERKDKENS